MFSILSCLKMKQCSKVILDMLLNNSRQKRKNKQYIPTTEEIEHVDSLLKMFIALTGDKHFESLYNTLKRGSNKDCRSFDVAAFFDSIFEDLCDLNRGTFICFNLLF